MSQEAFEKWADANLAWDEARGLYEGDAIAHDAWQARQPEIDALIREREEWIKKWFATAEENDALKAELERLRKDAERLDFLDSNKRFQMGWSASVAPVGNVKITSIIMGGSPIRDAIDASMMETGKRFSPQAIMETLKDDAVLGKYIVTVPPAAPAPEVEPAVYYFGFINRTFTYTRFKDEAAAHQKRIAEEGGIEQRLYTHPASDDLVKAAEWYVECYEKHTPEMTDDAYKQLRAELEKVKT